MILVNSYVLPLAWPPISGSGRPPPFDASAHAGAPLQVVFAWLFVAVGLVRKQRFLMMPSDVYFGSCSSYIVAFLMIRRPPRGRPWISQKLISAVSQRALFQTYLL